MGENRREWDWANWANWADGANRGMGGVLRGFGKNISCGDNIFF